MGTLHAPEQLSLRAVITEKIKINKYSERAACLFVRGFPGVVLGCSFSQVGGPWCALDPPEVPTPPKSWCCLTGHGDRWGSRLPFRADQDP